MMQITVRYVSREWTVSDWSKLFHDLSRHFVSHCTVTFLFYGFFLGLVFSIIEQVSVSQNYFTACSGLFIAALLPAILSWFIIRFDPVAQLIGFRQRNLIEFFVALSSSFVISGPVIVLYFVVQWFMA